MGKHRSVGPLELRGRDVPEQQESIPTTGRDRWPTPSDRHKDPRLVRPRCPFVAARGTPEHRRVLLVDHRLRLMALGTDEAGVFQSLLTSHLTDSAAFG